MGDFIAEMCIDHFVLYWWKERWNRSTETQDVR